mmetsp:Transcript_23274/g.23511  ORF Transcript_23274/g.23511 Transcript_23274/m.23511 type:complete len:101 (-) Transcript_23274:254-556(-)
MACGKTVTTVPLSDQINGIVGGRDHYLAVSSIVLEDQNLVGSIVTGIDTTTLPQLELLDLSHNNLKGNTLHDTFLSLRILQLQYNALSGTIPFNFVGSGK